MGKTVKKKEGDSVKELNTVMGRDPDKKTFELDATLSENIYTDKGKKRDLADKN